MDRVVLFAKAPLPGKAKMRLADEIGPARAARVAEALLGDTLEMLEEIPTRPGAAAPRLVLAWTDAIEWFTPRLESNWRLIEQRGRDLGERLEHALLDLAPAPEDKTVFVGMDCPHMPPERMEEAFEALDEAHAVIGPCDDGGYYLLGVRGALPAAALRAIRWGTEDALTDTIAALEGAGMSVVRLAPGYDINTLEDLRRLASDRAADALNSVANVMRAVTDLGL